MRNIELNNRISELLARFVYDVKTKNSNSEFDINVISENVMIPIFNILFDCKFKNANLIEHKNYPAVDLVDKHSRIAIQITSSNTESKIISTLEKFENYKLYENYEKLYIYILTEKREKYRKKNIESKTNGRYSFKVERNILDYRDLYEMAINQHIEKIIHIRDILEEQFADYNYKLNSMPFKPSTSISFSEEDIEIAEVITNKLIDLGVNIYSESKALSNRIFGKKIIYYHEVNEQLPDESDFCIVLLSDSYQDDILRNQNNNSILTTAIEKNNQILPFSIEKDFNLTVDIKDLKKAIPIDTTNEWVIVNYFIDRLYIYSLNYLESFKSYKDIETLLRIANGNAVIEKSDEYMNRTMRIGYELFSIKGLMYSNSVSWVIYLYSDINQKQTSKMLYLRNKQLSDSNQILILLPKEINIQNQEIRKKNISDTFNISLNNVHFIDDFVWKFCMNKEFKEYHKSKFYLKWFVFPHITENDKIVPNDSGYIKNWLDSDHDPILVVKGAGGIGKTTFAQYVANETSKKAKEMSIIFIDSHTIVNSLRDKLVHAPEIDIYDFYETYHATQLGNIPLLTKDLFKLSLDNGNILLIIDGLDEIISKLGLDFDINRFLKSIHELSDSFGIGKVIITCRNYFWDGTNPKIQFRSIDLKPFDKKLVITYFKRRHPSIKSIDKKGLKLAKSFMIDSNKIEVFPYTLDIINYLIEDNVSSDVFNDPSFDSLILNQNRKSDYIIFRICNREVIRLEQLNVDQQIKLFIQIAVNYQSNITNQQLNQLYNNLFEDKEKRHLESFKAHPLLKYNNNILSFKYDFHSYYFKIIYLEECLTKEHFELNINMINIIINNISYDSFFTTELALRMEELTDQIKYNLLTIIEEIMKGELKTLTKIERRKAISNTFIIALKLLHKKVGSNKQNNTELLKDFFGREELTQVILFNLSSYHTKIVFNFDDLKITDCYICGYENFWECSFNSNTRFRNSTIKNLPISQISNTLAKSENFVDCHTDHNVEITLQRKSEESSTINNRILSDLKHFFNIFYSGGYIHSQPESLLKRRYRRSIISYNLLFKTLYNVIIESIIDDRKQKKIQIINDYKIDVQKFCHEGTMSIKIKEVFSMLVLAIN